MNTLFAQGSQDDDRLPEGIFDQLVTETHRFCQNLQRHGASEGVHFSKAESVKLALVSFQSERERRVMTEKGNEHGRA